MLMVLWTVDTDDYLRPGVATIVHRALAGARPGAIIATASPSSRLLAS
jgi:peptidoglycan-N-acetylglucosamine deacetylase